MRVGEAFGSYLKTEDLGGRRVTVTIESVTVEEVGEEKKRKPVASLVGKEKRFVINKTNADILIDILGTDEMDDWAGRRIVLYPGKTKFGGRTVPCISVAAHNQAATSARPSPAPPPPPADEPEEFEPSDDDVPF
jgi:hypothetical protein